MNSPNWLITCSRCGRLYVEGYEIECWPKTEPYDGSEIQAVHLRHLRKDDNGDILYDCPIETPTSAASDQPRGGSSQPGSL